MTPPTTFAESALNSSVKKSTRRPRKGWAIAIALSAPLILGACAEIIPKVELRDDYMFKRFLQPDRVVSDVRRDEHGNPILPEKSSAADGQ